MAPMFSRFKKGIKPLCLKVLIFHRSEKGSQLYSGTRNGQEIGSVERLAADSFVDIQNFGIAAFTFHLSGTPDTDE